MTDWIGIAAGDMTGIGPEVALKALASEIRRESSYRFLLLGDWDRLCRLNESLRLGLPMAPFRGFRENAADRLAVWNPCSEVLPENMPCGDERAARAAVAYLRDGAERCRRGELAALVTAPVNKESIIKAGHPSFVGQTEFLSRLAGAERTAMMLLGRDERGRWLRVILATTHVPIRKLADALTRDKVDLAIEMADLACRELELPRRKIAVCGLNPHAGEGGKMGDEEQTVIAPAVRAAVQRGLDVCGPFAADALFHYVMRGDYDVVVAMYHDQGLAPLKMIGFETGINWTVGLPFIRTSPDHGTAYDIAGRGCAHPGSMVSAVRLAVQLARTRARRTA